MKRITQPTKKRKEVRIASREKEYVGLCSSCKSASTCTYTKDPMRPVLQCEEFDGYEPRSVGIISRDSLPLNELANPPLISSAEEKDSGKYKGLCSICEDRETCTFLKPEGGVWHCEEYR